jgi:transcriptional regulator with XRE-family HTH domain
MSSKERISIGPALKRLREKSSFKSLEALANASGLSVSYLSLVERDKREPSLSALNKIAAAFGMPLSVLFLSLYAENLSSAPESVLSRLASATQTLTREIARARAKAGD